MVLKFVPRVARLAAVLQHPAGQEGMQRTPTWVYSPYGCVDLKIYIFVCSYLMANLNRS